MSSESRAGNPAAANPRFPGQRSSSQGQPGAKPRPVGVGEAQLVDIPAPAARVDDGATEEGSSTGFWTSPRCRLGRGPGKSGPRRA